MRKNYLIACFILLLTALSGVSSAVYARLVLNSDSLKSIRLKDSRPNRYTFEPLLQKNFESLLLKNTPKSAKTSNTPSRLNSIEVSRSAIDNVRVYPNPVSTYLNLKYSLSKENLVTIKIVDILGNEVMTLLSQKQSAGEQSNSFNVSSRLNSGLYFVRIVAGSESVIKRISVL